MNDHLTQTYGVSLAEVLAARSRYRGIRNSEAHTPLPSADDAAEALVTKVPKGSPYYNLMVRIFAIVYGITESEMHEKCIAAFKIAGGP